MQVQQKKYRQKPLRATHKQHKRSYCFLLLELLIALALFSLCILPLASMPIHALTQEIMACQRMQLQRLADLAFADVKAMLYQNAIAWEELDSSKSNKALVLKDSVVLKGKEIGTRTINRDCFVWSSSRKKGKDQEEYRLVTVEIRLTTPQQGKFFLFKNQRRNSLSFYYRVFIVQQNENPIQDPSSLKLALYRNVTQKLASGNAEAKDAGNARDQLLSHVSA